MPDRKKAREITVTGYCPQQDREYSITVHVVPHRGVWKRFGFTCGHRLEEKRDCAHTPCPLWNQPIPNQLP